MTPLTFLCQPFAVLEPISCYSNPAGNSITFKDMAMGKDEGW
jgi:hypothetical protein